MSFTQRPWRGIDVVGECFLMPITTRTVMQVKAAFATANQMLKQAQQPARFAISHLNAML